MTKIEAIESEVQKLSLAELSTFREWFFAFDSEVWDRQIERDAGSGKLEKLAAESLAAHRRGESREL